ncbi:RdgB/HAM1 family non-canonical purine NTP pyrophosphatase [Aminipila butyrica]|uniref:dITP/XTP pyrophosphatase n=1 Tax=Aminipila butyrica TaxID=433296 RepID=A0A858BT32_9FIRM|nr:RdgB/HAM1 family non-canonical purine NTP pyrophosphatase [Aminipila butyrica]QIB68359.1 RdgB/HAM1 family non-canonical purine NTP pyrophosphatase [Aminipila butyrica]
MTMLVVAASQNQHKIDELEAIMRRFGMSIIGRDQFGLPKTKIEEDGDTFEANSLKKANEINLICHQITVADDSGLMVDALDGAPGVYSSRFAGEEGNDQKNNEKLLEMLKDVPLEKRTARFVSVITMVYPNRSRVVARGECEGHILFEASGEHGFGYDPLFRPLGYDVSFGQLTAEEKNKISHRAKALEDLQRQLELLHYVKGGI